MEQQDHDGDNDDDGDDDLFENSSFHKIVKMPQQWSSLPKKIHLLFSLQVNATTEPLDILPLDSADPVSCPGPGHVHSVIFPRGVVHRVENGWGLTKVAAVLLNGVLW